LRARLSRVLTTKKENKNSLAAARVSSACSPFCWLQMNLDLL
jgi:hypothetical protein